MLYSPVDLWRALGGDERTLGTIQRDDIARILAQEFELVNGVAEWLAEAEADSGMIRYTAFKALFEAPIEECASFQSSILGRTEANDRQLQLFENWANLHGL